MPFSGLTVPSTFADEGTGGRNTILIEGDNLLEIERVVPSPEKVDSGKEFIAYRTKVVAGPAGNVGKTFSHLGSMGENAGWTHNIVVAAGADPSKLKNAKLSSYKQFEGLCAMLESSLKGKRVGAVIYTDTYNGKENSKVSQFYPATQFVEHTPSAPAESLDDVLGGLLNGNAG